MAKEGRRDDDKLSRKRKNSEDLEDVKLLNDEAEGGGKRRDKHRHKHHHRKHKHRRHKHGEEGSSAKEDDGPPSVDLPDLRAVPTAVDETEDGEILEEAPAALEDGQIEVAEAKEDDACKHRSSSRDSRRSQEEKKARSRSPDTRLRGASPDRKHRSKSREDYRHSSRLHSPDRRAYRSRSRDAGGRKVDERSSRKHGYSPERRSRDYAERDPERKPRDYAERDRPTPDRRGRDYLERDRYSRRLADSSDRAYRDDRASRDDRYRDRTSSYRREREEHQEERRKEETSSKEENQEVYLERVAHQLAEQDEDEEKVKEERRQRRQAIMEKYRSQQESGAQANESSGTVEPDTAGGSSNHEAKHTAGPVEPASEKDTGGPVEPASEKDTAVPVEPASEMDTGGLVEPASVKNIGGPVEPGTSNNEEDTDGKVTGAAEPAQAFTADDGEGVINPSPLLLGKPSPEIVDDSKRNPVGLGEGSPKDERSVERSADMFCDIFGESPPKAVKVVKPDGMHIDTSALIDNWDDAEGYYTYRIGEVLDGRYEIASSHGKGVFSTVVRARDTKPALGEPLQVAIKIIRNNETMYKAGQTELVILRKLAGADPENRRHCVRLLSSFEYRNHLCLVFESLHMNLREILKKFGRNIGISLKAVRAYAQQLFTALKHLRNCGVLHCDIKPDNMLVNEPKNVLKLCDFGSAMFAGENEITPYLVSRFYRAPEIILGLPYDHALDMWSVGCCLYELCTGKVLFPGPSNNDMLRLHMELKGPFPKKMLKKAGFAHQHFDQDFNFWAIEEDPVSKKTMKRMMNIVKPKEISALIPGNGEEDPKLLGHFKNLLERMFILDPEKRLTVSQALNHPFIVGGK